MSTSTEQLSGHLRGVRVGVRPDLDVSRHVFGDEIAYVVRDPISFQSHRLSVSDYRVFTEISDRRTLGDVFRRLVEAQVVESDQEEAFYRYVISLTQRGLLNLPLADGGRLHKRFEERKRAARKNWLMNALFLRVPLAHPDRLLSHTIDLVRPLFTSTAVILWVISFAICVGVAWARWEELASPLASILAVHNIPILWSLLVGLKVIHEFGHAYACKHYGGQVPEMGAYFILFTPCAYVDASASWGFPSRWSRIVVAVAGMYFESIVAMLALSIWVLTPPGTIHDASHYALVLSTVVTIAFNANPLMRYDGYYILSDLTGIPNLRSQAERHLRDLLVRVLYGVRRATSEIPRHRVVGLLLFGVFAAIYKVTLVFGLSLVLAFQLPLIGIALALIYVFGTVRQSIGSWIKYLRFAEELVDRRRQAVVTSIGVSTMLLMIIGLLPLPRQVEMLAVVAPMDETTVRAEVAGFVREMHVGDGDHLRQGELVCELENAELDTNVTRLSAAAEASAIAWKQAMFEPSQLAAQNKADLEQVSNDLEQAIARQQSLRVHAFRPGIVTRRVADTPGAFVRRGDPLIEVGAGEWTLRTLLTAEQLVDTQLVDGDPVHFRFFDDPQRVHVGRILSVAPAGDTHVVRPELTHLGGGTIAVDSNSHESAEPLFAVTIAIPHDTNRSMRAGSMARVRVEAVRHTIIAYLLRRGLQLLHDLQMVA